MRNLFLLFSILIFLTSCQKENFDKGKEVNDFFHIKSGDYVIPILVRGNTESNKIILFADGGPGNNTLDFAHIDFPGWRNTLEKDYAIAYFDYRGTGNAQGNFDLGERIYETYLNDLHVISGFLKKAYNSEIILMGHSFGGGLVYEYCAKYGNNGIPVKYISVCGPATTDADLDTLRWKFRREFLYNTALLEISRNNNVNEWNEVLDWLAVTPVISKVSGNNPYLLMDTWNGYVEDLVYKYYDSKSIRMRDYLKVFFLSSYNPFPAFLNQQEREYLSTLFNSEDKLGYSTGSQLMERLSLISSQSILLIGGRYDDVCPPEELNYIFSRITSPNKQIQLIDYSGHEIYNHQADIFYNAVKAFIQ